MSKQVNKPAKAQVKSAGNLKDLENISQEDAMKMINEAGLKTPAEFTPENAIEFLKSNIGLIREFAEMPLGDTPLGNPSADFAAELGSIDFHKMISGPLQAAVDAQVASSMATVNFIKEVGFEQVNDPTDTSQTPAKITKIREVDFTHFKTTTKPDPDDATETIQEKEEVIIRVPFLAMLPIPSLRIQEVNINFNCKLNSVESKDISTKIGVDVGVSGGFGPVKFKVNASYQRQSTMGIKVEKEYTLGVNVKAVQDEIPAGLEKILNMLAA